MNIKDLLPAGDILIPKQVSPSSQIILRELVGFILFILVSVKGIIRSSNNIASQYLYG